MTVDQQAAAKRGPRPEQATTAPTMFVVEVRGFGHDATTVVGAKSPGEAVKAACAKYGLAVRVVGEFAARSGAGAP